MGKIKISIFIVIAAAFFFAGIAAAASGIEPTDPAIYMIFGKAGVVSASDQVSWDGEVLTYTTTYEGKTFLHTSSVVDDGEHIVSTSVSTTTVQTVDLTGVEEYSSNGVYVNPVDDGWGRTGIVVYPVADEWQIITISGFGYEAYFPAGTEYWDGEIGEWTLEPVFSFYTVIRIFIPSQPTYQYQFLPLVSKGEEIQEPCLDIAPFLPIYWQFSNGVGICSDGEPDPIQGVNPEKIWNQELYNWYYPDLLLGWYQDGEQSDGIYLQFIPNGSPIGVWEHFSSPGFDAIYTINGSGYTTIQSDWGDQLYYWDSSTRSWSATPVWGNLTIIGVEDR